MNDTKHSHDAVSLRVPVNHDVGRNDADSNVRPDLGTRRAAVGEVGEQVIELFEASVVFVRDAITGFGGKVSNNLGGVRVRRWCDDDVRH